MMAREQKYLALKRANKEYSIYINTFYKHKVGKLLGMANEMKKHWLLFCHTELEQLTCPEALMITLRNNFNVKLLVERREDEDELILYHTFSRYQSTRYLLSLGELFLTIMIGFGNFGTTNAHAVAHMVMYSVYRTTAKVSDLCSNYYYKTIYGSEDMGSGIIKIGDGVRIDLKNDKREISCDGEIFTYYNGYNDYKYILEDGARVNYTVTSSIQSRHTSGYSSSMVGIIILTVFLLIAYVLCVVFLWRWWKAKSNKKKTVTLWSESEEQNIFEDFSEDEFGKCRKVKDREVHSSGLVTVMNVRESLSNDDVITAYDKPILHEVDFNKDVALALKDGELFVAKGIVLMGNLLIRNVWYVGEFRSYLEMRRVELQTDQSVEILMLGVGAINDIPIRELPDESITEYVGDVIGVKMMAGTHILEGKVLEIVFDSRKIIE